MKYVRSVSIAVLALACAASISLGADLSVKPVYTKAPVAVASAVQFYGGLSLQGSAFRDHIDFLTVPGQLFGTGALNPSAPGVGAVFGIKSNWANGGWGALEADVHYLIASRAGTQCLLLDQCTTRNNWTGSIVAKVGAPVGVMTGALPNVVPSNLPIPVTLPTSPLASAISLYAAAGVRWRNVGACIEGPVSTQGCSNTILWGATIGGGLVAPITPTDWFDFSVMYDRYDHGFVPGASATPAILTGNFKAFDGATGSVKFVHAF